MSDEIVPLPAATVTLVRDSAHGPEVLMMRRNLQSGFVPGAHVFPGGALDNEDDAPELRSLCAGLSDDAANQLLGVAGGGLAYWAAAIRESFEEAGVLVAYDSTGGVIALDQPALAERFRRHRHALNAGERGFIEIMREEGLRLATDQLVYFSHWITPVTAPRRYDTRFFIAAAPPAQEPLHDNQETIGHLWVRPAAALALHRENNFSMRLPTIRTLEEFAAYDSVSSLLAAMRNKRDIDANLPRITKSGNYLVPGDAGYAEAATEGKQGRWKI
jgi:8-oxo-dGTP pyrophosphatase MutT (NUDIX family)